MFRSNFTVDSTLGTLVVFINDTIALLVPHVSIDDEDESLITEIKKDMGRYATSGCTGGAIKIFKSIHSTQVCETEIRTPKSSLQGYVG